MAVVFRRPGISPIDGSPAFGRAAFGMLMPAREKGAQTYRRVSTAARRTVPAR
jgi:hypothetical protein